MLPISLISNYLNQRQRDTEKRSIDKRGIFGKLTTTNGVLYQIQPIIYPRKELNN